MYIIVGDFVKVPINDRDGVEKMWFEILFIDNNETFIGRCDNIPIAVTSIEYNEHKKFNINEIIEKL